MLLSKIGGISRLIYGWHLAGWTIQTKTCKQVRPRAEQNMGWFKLTAGNKKLQTIVKSAKSF